MFPPPSVDIVTQTIQSSESWLQHRRVSHIVRFFGCFEQLAVSIACPWSWLPLSRYWCKHRNITEERETVLDIEARRDEIKAAAVILWDWDVGVP